MKAIQLCAWRVVLAFCLLGASSAAAITQPGMLVAWGDNSYGQADVPLGLINVMAIAAGDIHSLALQSNGTVVAWGKYRNESGYVPMTVPAGLSNVVAIAAGGYHSLALQGNGTVVDWGVYQNGSQYVPFTAPAGLSNVAAIAAGRYHSLALQSNGTLVAWGGAAYGVTNVPPGLSNVAAIAQVVITVWRSRAAARWSPGAQSTGQPVPRA